MFQIPRKSTSLEEIYNNLEENPILISVFSNLLMRYANIVFNIDNNKYNENIDIKAALKFADLMSKAKNIHKADEFVILGQELIILLNHVFPNDKTIEYYLINILSYLSNYRGLKSKNLQGKTTLDSLDGVFYEYEKQQLAIPWKNDENFFYSQKYVFDGLKNKYFSYSGPTSMGKSFLIQVYIKDLINKGVKQNFAIIVPTKALINEVRHNILTELKQDLEKYNYRIVSGAGDLVLKQEHNFIFVLTPERLLHILISKDTKNIDFAFVDEAHKISEKSDRSVYYYKVIDKIISINNNATIVFASPNIPNPEVYLQTVSNIKSNEIKKLSSKYSPVSQFKFLVDYKNKVTKVYNDLTQEFMQINFDYDYSDNLYQLINRIGKNAQNVVYCSSIENAALFAVDYAKNLMEIDDAELKKLSDDIKKYVYKDCYLTDLVKKGVAYHVSYLPSHIKRRIEEAFENKHIKTIFCTSTLVEGVNLPADNMFVLNYRNGKRNFDEVSFKNLIGRVGRIKYNLFGNVFLLIKDKKTNENGYKSLLTSKVPMQRLSTNYTEYKQFFPDIIKDLSNGDLELSSIKDVANTDTYPILRKFAIALIRDIGTNRNTTIKKAFDEFLDISSIIKINEKFPINVTNDDISVSNDQTDRLKEAIASGLAYPELTDDFDYEEVVKFLIKLHDIFKWNIYERKTVGRIGDNLRWYALVLLWWMQGYGVNVIIKNSIKYKSGKNESYIQAPNHNLYEFNPEDKKHINWIIGDILDVINNVILFTISNYFRKFSIEYKSFHNIENFDNDWYNFVEYGTTNPLTIFLQQIGFTRDASKYLEIPSNKTKYLKENGENDWLLYNTILECDDMNTKMDANDIKINMPELFIDQPKEK